MCGFSSSRKHSFITDQFGESDHNLGTVNASSHRGCGKKKPNSRQTDTNDLFFLNTQLYIVYYDLDLDFVARFLCSTLQQIVKAKLKRYNNLTSLRD